MILLIFLIFVCPHLVLNDFYYTRLFGDKVCQTFPGQSSRVKRRCSFFFRKSKSTKPTASVNLSFRNLTALDFKVLFCPSTKKILCAISSREDPSNILKPKKNILIPKQPKSFRFGGVFNHFRF